MRRFPILLFFLCSAMIMRAQVEELPLPAVPDTLCTVESRAGFVAMHFWDALDFADTRRSTDRSFMEQNFVNFLSIFGLANGDTQRAAARLLVERAAADSTAYDLLTTLAEQYLYDNLSPMYCDAHYVPFLEAQLAQPRIEKEQRERLEFQLAVAGSNLPGAVAPDFEFETYQPRDSRAAEATTTLHNFLSTTTLLVFYDPDCDRCHELLSALAGNEALNRRIADGQLAILAVDAEDDEEAWRRDALQMPTNWTVAIDRSQLQERDSYYLRFMPMLFLLDANGVVLMKDPSLEALISSFVIQ